MKKALIFIGKIIGKVWIFACIPFRAYARSVVYNYILQTYGLLGDQQNAGKTAGDMPLKRLYERCPTKRTSSEPAYPVSGWVLYDIHGVGRNGFVEYRKVSKLQFYLIAIFIWSFLDDDSNEDTTDKGYIKTIVDGERSVIPHALTLGLVAGLISLPIAGWLAITVGCYVFSMIALLAERNLKKLDFSKVNFGNAFDLGDVRSDGPFYNFWATLVWNDRNSFMNFQYLWDSY